MAAGSQVSRQAAEVLATIAEQEAVIQRLRLEVEELTLQVGWLGRIA